MRRSDPNRTSNRGLAVAFALLLVVVVGVRVLVVWLSDSRGWARLAVSIGIVAVFVGVPAAYGLRGLLRGNDDPGQEDEAES